MARERHAIKERLNPSNHDQRMIVRRRSKSPNDDRKTAADHSARMVGGGASWSVSLRSRLSEILRGRRKLQRRYLEAGGADWPRPRGAQAGPTPPVAHRPDNRLMAPPVDTSKEACNGRLTMDVRR